jgi:fructose-1-phosphate kinase PfkB-like protein
MGEAFTSMLRTIPVHSGSMPTIFSSRYLTENISQCARGQAVTGVSHTGERLRAVRARVQ